MRGCCILSAVGVTRYQGRKLSYSVLHCCWKARIEALLVDIRALQAGTAGLGGKLGGLEADYRGRVLYSSVSGLYCSTVA